MLFLLWTTALGLQGFSQNNYSSTDEFVQKQGSMDSLNLAQIAQRITAVSSDKEQQARAIFYWIANNIALDPKAIKGNDQRKSLPEDVTKLRKGTALGFAKLYQEMASIANIRCLVVDGYIRNGIEDLNSPPDEINHSWNVVQLGQSPDSWYVLDAAKAGDELALDSLNKSCYYLGWVLATLSMVLDPQAYIIGGGVSKAGTFLTDMIKKYHDELSPMATKKADIVLAKLGNDAGIYGAAKLILG